MTKLTTIVYSLSKINIYTLAVAMLGLFHLTANYAWLSLNKVPFSWDEAGHAIIALRFTDFFKTGTGNFLSISDYYPPFVHLLVTFFMLLFGTNIIIGPLAVTGFFLMAIIFLYLYTGELLKDRFAALLAAFIFSFLPNIYALSRQFLLDIPLLAMTLGALFFLERSGRLRIRKYAILFAVFFSLSLAVKWTAVIFLFIPVAVKLWRGFPLPWKNLGLGMGIILAVNLPWYLYNLPVILHAAEFTATPEPADPQQILSFENFKFYFFSIANFQLTAALMVVFLISAAYLADKRKINYLLPAYFFVYLAFTFIGNKDLRYVIFLAPAAAVVTAHFLSSLREKLPVQVLTAALGVYLLFLNLSLSFGVFVNPLKADFRYSVQIPFLSWVDLINLGKETSSFLAPIYNQTVWPNRVIVSELSGHNPGKAVKILVVGEKPYLNQVNMELQRRELNLTKIRFFAPYELAPFVSGELLEKYLLSFDVILAADKDLGFAGSLRNFAVLKQISDYLRTEKSANLIKINEYPLPDGDKLNVYKPREDPK